MKPLECVGSGNRLFPEKLVPVAKSLPGTLSERADRWFQMEHDVSNESFDVTNIHLIEGNPWWRSSFHFSFLDFLQCAPLSTALNQYCGVSSISV